MDESVLGSGHILLIVPNSGIAAELARRFEGVAQVRVIEDRRRPAPAGERRSRAVVGADSRERRREERRGAHGSHFVGALVDTPRKTRTVLVVEDEATVREMLSDMLSMAGYHVETVRDGLAGLEALGAQTYDLVVSDIKMPRLDGMTFYWAAVRRHPTLARRFIFLTGSALTPDVQAFAQMSGVPILAKPFDIRDLDRLVRQVLED